MKELILWYQQLVTLSLLYCDIVRILFGSIPR